ncbi:MAG: restriction endonuclease subunit S [Methylococcales bacterium]|nr:restriction endonuclease subunit S [Methylococcales bacterium]
MINRGEIEKRFDPFYYIPEIVELEQRVRKISKKRLKDFIISMASGSTPSVTEEEKFYSDAENGVPFIRVQNLSSTNELMINDLKYINQETHQKYLNRSQIKEGNLLIKITGVGRMAVSSVVPKEFEGNINQHLVVIKTKDNFTSEVLATFLNTDIAERLASKRATGGTRPALDYAALKSMPIVFKPEIVEIVKQVITVKNQKEAEAAALLASIDGYLLQELGITLPPPSEKKNYFLTHFSKVSSTRLDPFYHLTEFDVFNSSLKKSNFNLEEINNICFDVRGVTYSNSDETTEGKKILRANNIDLQTNELNLSDIRYIREDFKISDNQLLRKNDIFMCAASGSKSHSGKVAFIEEDTDFYFGGFMMVLRSNENVLPKYLFEILASSIFRKFLTKILGGTNINNLNFSMFRNYKIPLPPPEKQTEIANHISALRTQAKQLQQQAAAELAHAKQHVEQLILGE